MIGKGWITPKLTWLSFLTTTCLQYNSFIAGECLLFNWSKMTENRSAPACHCCGRVWLVCLFLSQVHPNCHQRKFSSETVESHERSNVSWNQIGKDCTKANGNLEQTKNTQLCSFQTWGDGSKLHRSRCQRTSSESCKFDFSVFLKGFFVQDSITEKEERTIHDVNVIWHFVLSSLFVTVFARIVVFFPGAGQCPRVDISAGEVVGCRPQCEKTNCQMFSDVERKHKFCVPWLGRQYGHSGRRSQVSGQRLFVRTFNRYAYFSQTSLSKLHRFALQLNLVAYLRSFRLHSTWDPFISFNITSTKQQTCSDSARVYTTRYHQMRFFPPFSLFKQILQHLSFLLVLLGAVLPVLLRLQLGPKADKLLNSARLQGYCQACGCVEPSPDDLFSRTQAALAANSKVWRCRSKRCLPHFPCLELIGTLSFAWRQS